MIKDSAIILLLISGKHMNQSVHLVGFKGEKENTHKHTHKNSIKNNKPNLSKKKYKMVHNSAKLFRLAETYVL